MSKPVCVRACVRACEEAHGITTHGITTHELIRQPISHAVPIVAEDMLEYVPPDVGLTQPVDYVLQPVLPQFVPRDGERGAEAPVHMY